MRKRKKTRWKSITKRIKLLKLNDVSRKAFIFYFSTIFRKIIKMMTFHALYGHQLWQPPTKKKKLSKSMENFTISKNYDKNFYRHRVPLFIYFVDGHKTTNENCLFCSSLKWRCMFCLSIKYIVFRNWNMLIQVRIERTNDKWWKMRPHYDHSIHRMTPWRYKQTVLKGSKSK